MRLTLRTLLAYLDDILEPADARDLGQKIEESEVASGLVHRIRSVTRKLRLGAPKLGGKGMGLDANTVAEYLDNTLPQVRVPDFEKVCLESDVHLAEVASCHQILTLVLGEPADVDPALRDRIRGLLVPADQPQGETSDSFAMAPPAGPPESPPVVQRKEQQEDWDEPKDWDDQQVPDVTPSTEPAAAAPIRLMPIVATLVVAFLLALVALIAMGPLDSSHPVLGGLLPDAQQVAGAESSPGDDQEQLATTQPETSSTLAPGSGAAAGTSSTSPTTTAPPTTAPPTTAPPTTATDRAGDETAQPSTLPPPPGAAAADSSAGADSSTAAAQPSAETPGNAGATEPAMAPGAAGTATSEAPVAGTELKEPEPIARCVSGLHVLARWDGVQETWMRMTANQPVVPEQDLVALPTYRPMVTFTSGISLTLVGPARVRMRDTGTEPTPGIEVLYGRILLSSNGAPGAAIELTMGDRRSRVSLPNVDSSVALDVQRYLEPGEDPEVTAAHWLIQALAVAGNPSWQDEATAPVGLSPGQLVSMIGTREGNVTDAVPAPDWLDTTNMRLIERDASEHLEPLLDLERPLTMALMEQTTNRLVEVRALAMRSLCALEVFDSYLVNALNTKTLRTFWPDLVFAMQLAIAQGPEPATQVRTTLERLRGKEGTQLFRLLWRYSPEQLVEGEAESLVQALANPAMDIRVLAYENLFSIAEKTNAYQPELDPSRQRRAILNWQRDLEQGQVKHKKQPFELD